MKIIRIMPALLLAAALTSCSLPPVMTGADFPVRIMSFNLRYDNPEDEENCWNNRKAAVVKMLNDYKPSVVGIQEGESHMVAYLDASLPLYDRVGVGRDDGEEAGEFNAVYWLKDHFKLLDSGTFWLSETPDYPSYGWDAACRRIVSWVKLRPEDDEKDFYLFNTHLDHRGAEARKESVELIMRKINEIAPDGAPVYLTGDLNTVSIDPVFTPFRESLYDARHTAEKRDAKLSFNAFGIFLIAKNLDFIFYRNANAAGFKTIDEDFGVPYISDHYPVAGNFMQ